MNAGAIMTCRGLQGDLLGQEHVSVPPPKCMHLLIRPEMFQPHMWMLGQWVYLYT